MTIIADYPDHKSESRERNCISGGEAGKVANSGDERSNCCSVLGWSASRRGITLVDLGFGPGGNRANEVTNTLFEYFCALEFAILSFAQR